jgi:acyl-CoA thioester hydrolase
VKGTYELLLIDNLTELTDQRQAMMAERGIRPRQYPLVTQCFNHDTPLPMVQDVPYNWLIEPQHVLSLTVREQDIDDFQHVNNVVYLGWMGRAAWDHSKKLGFDFKAYQAIDCGFVVKHHELDYLAPSFADDDILIATWISANDSRLRLRRRFQMVRALTGETLALGLSDFVTMRISTGKACRMPAEFAQGYPQCDGVEDIFHKARR